MVGATGVAAAAVVAGAVTEAAAAEVVAEATEVVAGEAAAGRAAGQVIVANKSLVGQHARAREQDILRPVFFQPCFRLRPR